MWNQQLCNSRRQLYPDHLLHVLANMSARYGQLLLLYYHQLARNLLLDAIHIVDGG